MWEAGDVMQQMKKDGIQPDVRTYTTFINACCKAGNMEVKISGVVCSNKCLNFSHVEDLPCVLSAESYGYIP
jgi:hypothetical protein